ncbi:MAG: FAD-binding oxidoreductase [Actinobacteria bacterium]|nr:FAD-binding oxidoreductase [Actinomycetota bacterium]
MTDIRNPRDDLVPAMRDIVGPGHVIDDPALMEQYVVDWARRFRGPARAVVRPGSTAEVSAIMRLCARLGVPVIPQGGNTGLVGGSVPAEKAPEGRVPVIISLRRLDHIGAVDHLSGQFTAGAGATLGGVRRAAASAGWVYGVDLAARDSATIGGTVATNAGGIHVIAYGMTRAQVVGIEAVLPDGTVVSHLSGLLKDNTGYDLGALLCGSEGTLAVITAVRLRLHRPVARTSVALIGCDTYDEALSLMVSAVAPEARLLAAEVIDEAGMDLACAVLGAAWPLEQRHRVLTLLEVVDGGDASGLVGLDDADVVVGLDASEKARLWAYRESQGEAFSSLGVTHKLDVSVPLPVLAACADELRDIVGAFPAVEVFGVFGHLADGNIHVEIYGPTAEDDAADLAILECVARYGGSISAEHGVGRAKAAELHLTRSPAEISAMRAIKAAWDPDGLMNPGVIFAAE